MSYGKFGLAKAYGTTRQTLPVFNIIGTDPVTVASDGGGNVTLDYIGGGVITDNTITGDGSAGTPLSARDAGPQRFGTVYSKQDATLKNVSLGYRAGGTGDTWPAGSADNVVIGVDSGLAMNGVGQNPNENVIIGSQSGQLLTNGDDNVIIGYTAGNAITTGQRNILIGAQAGPASSLSDTLAIGTGAVPALSGQIALGSVAHPYTFGTTVGAAGGGSALPATPIAYMIINWNGTAVKVPYYTF